MMIVGQYLIVHYCVQCEWIGDHSRDASMRFGSKASQGWLYKQLCVSLDASVIVQALSWTWLLADMATGTYVVWHLHPPKGTVRALFANP